MFHRSRTNPSEADALWRNERTRTDPLVYVPPVVNDVTPNAIDWPNVVSTANAQGTYVQVTGINTNITLRGSHTRTGFSVTAIVNSTNANDVGAVLTSIATTGTSFTVAPNQWVRFSGSSVNPLPDITTVTIRNFSDGNVILDTFTLDLQGAGGG